MNNMGFEIKAREEKKDFGKRVGDGAVRFQNPNGGSPPQII